MKKDKEIKSNYKIKKEYNMENYPWMYEEKDDKERNFYLKSFMKKTMNTKEIKSIIIKNIWTIYLWYLFIVLDYLEYDNSIRIERLSEEWIISLSMIKNCIKPKFKKSGLIKKSKWKYYLNPIIGIKWTSVSIELINMFSKENKDMYWMDLYNNKQLWKNTI